MENGITPVEPSEGSGAWARISAALYDPFLWVGERSRLRAHRSELLRQARGRTVEIGCGTGLNLAHYPDDVDDLILVEPDAAMRVHLEERLRGSHRRARVVDAPAQQLPFPDGSVDTVVSTFVLCTVDAPDRVVQEIGRVLRPDGELLFIEHVRSESPTLAAWQDRLAAPWRRFARGCRCNRAIGELMSSCGFQLEAVEDRWHGMPPIVRPLIIGRARLGHDVSETGSPVITRPRAASTGGG